MKSTTNILLAVFFVLALALEHIPIIDASNEANGLSYLRRREQQHRKNTQVMMEEDYTVIAPTAETFETLNGHQARRTKQQKNVKAEKAVKEAKTGNPKGNKKEKKDNKKKDEAIPDDNDNDVAVAVVNDEVDSVDDGTEGVNDEVEEENQSADVDEVDGDVDDDSDGDGTGTTDDDPTTNEDDSGTESDNGTDETDNDGSDGDGTETTGDDPTTNEDDSGTESDNGTDETDNDGSDGDGTETTGDDPTTNEEDSGTESDNNNQPGPTDTGTDETGSDGSDSEETENVESSDTTENNDANTTNEDTNDDSATTKTLPIITYGLQESCKTIDNSRYNICLDLVSESGEKEPWMDAFAPAVFRWEEIIIGDVPNQSTDSFFEEMRNTVSNVDEVIELYQGTQFPETIDDIYIKGESMDIDGEGKTLASASPLQEYYGVRDKVLPVIGKMVFDSSDIDILIQLGELENTILHEMGHVFGIGSLWPDANLNDSDFDGDPCDEAYLGDSFAQQEWSNLGCSGALPVECREGGEGTLGAHWDEGCLNSELMTGFSEDGEPTPLSKITIGTLKDQGYEVDFSAADPFSIDDLGDCPDFCPELATRRKRGLRPKDENRSGRYISQEAMEGLYISAYKIVTGNRPLNKVISSMEGIGGMSQGVDLVYLDEYNPNGPKIIGKYVSLEDAVNFLQNKDDAWLTANGIVVSD